MQQFGYPITGWDAAHGLRLMDATPGMALPSALSMIARVKSGALLGIDAYLVEVDVASRGLPKFSIIGLAEEAVRESRERAKAAIVNAGYKFPARRITPTFGIREFGAR